MAQDTTPDNDVNNNARDIRNEHEAKGALGRLSQKITDSIRAAPVATAKATKEATINSVKVSTEFAKNLTVMAAKDITAQLLLNKRGDDMLDRALWQSLNISKSVGSKVLGIKKADNSNVSKTGSGNVTIEKADVKKVDPLPLPIHVDDVLVPVEESNSQKIFEGIGQVFDGTTLLFSGLTGGFHDTVSKLSDIGQTMLENVGLLQDQNLFLAEQEEARKIEAERASARNSDSIIDQHGNETPTDANGGEREKTWKDMNAFKWIFTALDGIMSLARILLPFKKFLIGGALGFAVLAIAGFMMNSGKFAELMTSLNDIWQNQLIPAWTYIVDAGQQLATEIGRIWEQQFKPMIDDAIAWWNSEVSISFLDMVKGLTGFMADTVIFFFKNILPPALQMMGFAFKLAIGVIKEIWMFVSYLTPAFVSLFSNLVGDTVLYFQRLAEAFGNIFGENADYSSIVLGITQLMDAIVLQVLNVFDSILTFFSDALGISNLVGLMPGEKISEGVTRLFDYLVGAVSGWVDTFVGYLQEAIQFWADYNPVLILTRKISEFVGYIVGLIPNGDQLKAMISDAIKEVPGGDWILKNVFGSDTPTQDLSALGGKAGLNSMDNVETEQSKILDAKIAALKEAVKADQANMQTIIVQDNSSKSVSGGSGGRSRAVGNARTSPILTPQERINARTAGGY